MDGQLQSFETNGALCLFVFVCVGGGHAEQLSPAR